MASVETEKIKFELEIFVKLIPGDPKKPNYVTAERSKCILDQPPYRRAQGSTRVCRLRLGRTAGLTNG